MPHAPSILPGCPRRGLPGQDPLHTRRKRPPAPAPTGPAGELRAPPPTAGFRGRAARALPPSRAPGSERAAGPEIQTAPSHGACACAPPPAPAPRCSLCACAGWRALTGRRVRAGRSAGRAVVKLASGERAPRAPGGGREARVRARSG